MLRVINFNEGMFMTDSVFTDFTVVEILADAALVSHTDDWSYTAAITSNIYMGWNSASLGTSL
jgi:hypothetical protein